jgi:thioredoxin reductase
MRDRVRILVHSINDDRCTGCETCVDACPTNVLALVGHKSRPVRFDQCVQCEKCARVCPTQALAMHLEGDEPDPIVVPDIDEAFQTRVPGQYLIGEVAGKPLVKNAANLGRMVVEHMLATGLTAHPESAGQYDVVIVGSGPGGLSAALACQHHGLSYLVIDKERLLASTVARYPRGKRVMAEPADCRNLSFLPVYDCSKEELVDVWKELVTSTRMSLRLGEAVEAVTREADGSFLVASDRARYRARRVVLAIGVRGKPRTLGVPGESLDKVESMLGDPSDYAGTDALVVGGGDSALEAAAALADAGARVTLSYRKKSFSRAKKANVARVDQLAATGALTLALASAVTRFEPDSVTLRAADGSEQTVANQAAFVLIGADLPVRWLSKVGVDMVERPHAYSPGSSDALVARWAPRADDCPTDATAALARVRGVRLVRPPRRAATVESVVSRLRDAATGLFRRRDTGELSRVEPLAQRPPRARAGSEVDFGGDTLVDAVPPVFRD